VFRLVASFFARTRVFQYVIKTPKTRKAPIKKPYQKLFESMFEAPDRYEPQYTRCRMLPTQFPGTSRTRSRFAFPHLLGVWQRDDHRGEPGQLTGALLDRHPPTSASLRENVRMLHENVRITFVVGRFALGGIS
jgi:hypothetical protein